MPRYIFEIAGKRHIFEGPDPQTTAHFAEQWAKDNPPGGHTDPVTGYGTTAARAIPGLTELGAGYSAALRTADDALHGRQLDPVARFTQARQEQTGAVQDFQAQHPVASANATALGTLAPVAATMGLGAPAAAVRAAPVAAQGLRAVAARAAPVVAKNALTGAAVAGTYGLAQPGTLEQRAANAAGAIPAGAAFGAAIPAAVEAVPGAVGAVKNAFAPTLETPAGRLAAEGVPVLPGQRLGGAFKTVEEKATSVPILGDAISGAASRQREALNRAFANRALAPVGETLPADVATGHDAIAHVQTALGKKYDEAGALISNVQPDQQFGAELAKIGDALKDYPQAIQDQFAEIVKNRIAEPLAGGSGSGDQFIGITSQIRKLASRYGQSTDGAQRGLGEALDDLHAAVTDLGARQNPAYGEAKQTVDQGYATFKQLQRAGQAAGSREGVATPAQLKAAVRNSDDSVDNGRFAAGKARNQDLIRDADKVMGGNYPDSGTAGRLAINALALGGGHAIAPGVTVPAAAGLGVASVPYMLTGRGLGNAFANADPALLAQIAARGKGAIQAPAVNAMLPRSVTALTILPPAMVGQQQQDPAYQ